MDVIKAANDMLAFLLEIAALAAVALWGFTTGSSLPTRLVLGVGAPAVLIAAWGVWLAPASEQRLSTPWLLIAKLVVIGVATIALVAVGRPCVVSRSTCGHR